MAEIADAIHELIGIQSSATETLGRIDGFLDGIDAEPPEETPAGDGEPTEEIDLVQVQADVEASATAAEESATTAEAAKIGAGMSFIGAVGAALGAAFSAIKAASEATAAAESAEAAAVSATQAAEVAASGGGSGNEAADETDLFPVDDSDGPS